MTIQKEGFKPYLILTALLVFIAVMHFFAFTEEVVRDNPQFEVGVDHVLIFVFYYSCWISVIVAQFYMTSRILPRYGMTGVVVIFLVGLLVWLPTATIVDHRISEQVFSMDPKPVLAILKEARPLSFFIKSLLYSIFFGAVSIYIYSRMYHQMRVSYLEAERRSAHYDLMSTRNQLQALQSQLAPHFLFNCLNLMSILARKGDNEKIVMATSSLADLLRYVAEASKQTLIHLNEEIEFVNNFVALQQMRFGQRFNFSLTQGDTSRVQCPPFLLHTLVENAYSHAGAVEQCDIKLSLLRGEPQWLSIECVNNYDPSNGNSNSGMGIGLENLRKRLQLTYDDTATIESIAGDTLYIVKVKIPV
jgi:two-component system sensor histidine kinase AlgZ